MTTNTKNFGYSHTQKAPLCLLIYALAVGWLAVHYNAVLEATGR